MVDTALLTPWLGASSPLKCVLIKYSFFGISFLAIASHVRTMLTDPGAVPLDYQPNALLGAAEKGSQLSMCSRCNGVKPPRAHHCSQCDRCIMKMDHHCPWVNNCVGAANQKHFCLFCFYTCTLSCYAVLLLALRTASGVQEVSSEAVKLAHPPPFPGGKADVIKHRRGGHADPNAGRFLLLILLFLEALLFGLFTMAMLTEQLSRWNRACTLHSPLSTHRSPLSTLHPPFSTLHPPLTALQHFPPRPIAASSPTRPASNASSMTTSG